jgi:hypothetical protein
MKSGRKTAKFTFLIADTSIRHWDEGNRDVAIPPDADQGTNRGECVIQLVAQRITFSIRIRWDSMGISRSQITSRGSRHFAQIFVSDPEER